MNKFNYVIFNYYDNPHKIDKNGYYYICLEELYSLKNVHVVHYPLSDRNKILQFFYRIHNSYRINHMIRLPLKKIWYKYYFKQRFKEDNLCFVCIGPYITIDYIKYLKKKYPTAKFVKIHRDLVSTYQKGSPEWTNDKLREYYDLWVSYDKLEADRLNMLYYPEFESKITTPIQFKRKYDYDLFFAGAAKDRLPLLLEIAKLCEKNNISYYFYITGVKKEYCACMSGIVYANHFMPYREIIMRSINANCILELNQKNAVGYTARFLEAVMYNKKLLTNNLFVKKSPFYSEERINLFSNIDEISIGFIKKKEKVDFNYNGEFSPEGLIKFINNELNK